MFGTHSTRIYLVPLEGVLVSPASRLSSRPIVPVRDRLAHLKATFRHEAKIIAISTPSERPSKIARLWRSVVRYFPWNAARGPRFPDPEAILEMQSILEAYPGISEVWLAADRLLIVVTRRSVRAVSAPSLVCDRALEEVLLLVRTRYSRAAMPPLFIGTKAGEAQACCEAGVEFIPLHIWNSSLFFRPHV